MTSAISFNPYTTTNAQGTFSVQSDGYVQGEALDDPAVRYQLVGGTLATTEMLPMWGGVAITEDVPAPTSNGLGGQILRATSTPNLTGFAVFNQNYAAVQTPQSPVPLTGSGGLVNFYRLGSNARIPVQCDPTLAASLVNTAINSQVSWDYFNQILVPYITPAAPVNISSMTWNAGVLTVTTASAHGLTTGQYVQIAGVVPVGYNGSYVVAVTGPTTFTVMELTNYGTVTTQGTVTLGGGAIPVRVVDVKIGNCKTVAYDLVTNVATYNNNGTIAVIQI